MSLAVSLAVSLAGAWHGLQAARWGFLRLGEGLRGRLAWSGRTAQARPVAAELHGTIDLPP